MRKRYTKYLVQLLIILLGISFLTDYFSDNYKKEKRIYLQLVSSGQETYGILEDFFKESTNPKISQDAYFVKYTFLVADKKYSGQQTVHFKPTTHLITVKYLPKNPNINAINPQDELKYAKQMQKSAVLLFVGIILISIGMFWLYLKLKNIRNTNKKIK